VPAFEKDLEGWGATDKFTVALKVAGMNATELSAYCRERGLTLSRRPAPQDRLCIYALLIAIAYS
jgi:hypothetical protein